MSAGRAIFELDPAQASAQAAQNGDLVYNKFAGAVPDDVMSFGFLPDLSVLKPGDIILVQPKEPPPSPTDPIAFAKAASSGDVAWAIQDVQKRFQRGANAKWVHVALYLGRDLVVEATPPCVGVNAFSRYGPTHRIRVRRFPKLAPRLAYDACVEAMRRIGESYDVAAVLGLAQVYAGRATPKPELIKKSFICSELVQLAYYHGASKVIVNLGNTRTPTPADLAASPLLEDVNVGWRALT